MLSPQSTTLPTSLPTHGTPIAQVIAFTKEHKDQKRFIGAECHQSSFGNFVRLTRETYTYRMTKKDKKNYWKQVSDSLENPMPYIFEVFDNIKMAKKNGIAVYREDFHYINSWSRFDPNVDIVYGNRVLFV